MEGRTDRHGGSYHMNLHGMACALAGGARWGFSGTAGSYLFRSSGIDPMWVMSVRMILAGILFLLISVARGDRRPFELLCDKSAVRDLLLFAGAGLFLNQFSYLMAIQATNSATATVLQSLQLLPVAAVACVMICCFSRARGCFSTSSPTSWPFRRRTPPRQRSSRACSFCPVRRLRA